MAPTAGGVLVLAVIVLLIGAALFIPTWVNLHDLEPAPSGPKLPPGCNSRQWCSGVEVRIYPLTPEWPARWAQLAGAGYRVSTMGRRDVTVVRWVPLETYLSETPA